MVELPGWLKHATVWLVATVALFIGVQAWQARERATRFSVDGGTLELRRAPDGHYHWPGSVGGRAVDFLVDTGATGTAIPLSLARELRLPIVGNVQSNTAGGRVSAGIVVADVELDGGVRAARLPMAALPQLDAPLLGMDVLGRLHWQQSQGVLRIEMQRSAR